MRTSYTLDIVQEAAIRGGYTWFEDPSGKIRVEKEFDRKKYRAIFIPDTGSEGYFLDVPRTGRYSSMVESELLNCLRAARADENAKVHQESRQQRRRSRDSMGYDPIPFTEREHYFIPSTKTNEFLDEMRRDDYSVVQGTNFDYNIRTSDGTLVADVVIGSATKVTIVNGRISLPVVEKLKKYKMIV